MSNLAMDSPKTKFQYLNTPTSQLKRVPLSTTSSGSGTVCPAQPSINHDDLKTGLPIYAFCQTTKLWVKGHISTYTAGDKNLQVQTDREIIVASVNEISLRNERQAVSDVTDLTSLSPLSAPAVLDCLEERYGCDKFYTRAGSTILVVNPFKECGALYAKDSLLLYQSQEEGLAPHIYETAGAAYKGIHVGLGKVNHSVIVSGESGAGKTVSAKHVMKYLVTASQGPCSIGGSVGRRVERKILGSNPILEAFGNASTLRNHNSSRFGKYIELQFDRSLQIAGASIQTYLLEKTRITHQANGEHNFHILYQLLQGHGDLRVRQLLHPLSEITDEVTTPVFNIAPPGGRDCKQDTLDWITVKEAFHDMGFKQVQQDNIIKVLCALLHLGNIKICAEEDEDDVACFSSESQTGCESACMLLDIDPDKLEKSILNKRITASHRRRQSVFHKPCSPEQATVRRDCLAKVLYARLFEWLVVVINKSIQAENPYRTIGILDIYGFESFQNNSLEQLCINYANEKLQQHYVAHFLRDLQNDYAREAIPWTFTEFHDNRQCLELLENNPGLFALLDEECQLNRPSDDEALLDRIMTSLSTSSHLVRARRSKCAFTVKHYAEPVQYNVANLVEKNKDDVPAELVELLNQSGNEFISDLFSNTELLIPTGGKKKKSVLAKFKSSLDKLMVTLEQTQPHYVRCIKPNTTCSPGLFDQSYVLSQLQACGIIETVEISKQAFPARISYEDFLQQYGLILRSSDAPAGGPALNKSQADLDLEQNKENEMLFEPLDVLYRKQLNMSSRRQSSTTPKRKLRRRAEFGMNVIEQPVALEAGLSSADHTRRLSASIMRLVFGSQYTDQSTACAQFGKTKIFLKNGQLESLEAVRSRLLSAHVFTIQCAWRRYQVQKQRRVQQSVVTIQAVVRGWLVRKEQIQQITAAKKIQRAYRNYRQRTSIAAHEQIPLSLDSDSLSLQSTITCSSPQIGAMISSTCASHARYLNDSADRPSMNTPQQTSTPFYTPMTSRAGPSEYGDTEFYQTPLAPKTQPRRAKRHVKLDPLLDQSEDEFVLSTEQTPDGTTYHIIQSPHQGYPGGKPASDIFRTVASAISAAFLTRRRFHLAGAFTGIPYIEAHDGILSRRRLPRVHIKFHTRVNSLLKYGHYVHQRELQCGLQDCLQCTD